MLPRNLRTTGEQLRKLRRRELSEPYEPLDAGERVDAYQRQATDVAPVRIEPIQHLNQLELIIQIVLEPEHDLVMIAALSERTVTTAELIANALRMGPAASGDIRGSNRGELLEREAIRDRPFVQHVSPGEHLL